MEKEFSENKTKGESRTVDCRRCNGQTNHTVCNSLGLAWEDYGANLQGTENYEIIRCLGCDNISFRIGFSNSEDIEYDLEGNSFYPETEKLYPSRLKSRTSLTDADSLPRKIRYVYTETHAALRIKLRILAGIGIRTLIEAVCLEEGAKGKNLKTKINDLVKKEVLTKKNATILHKTRFLGNRTAHEIKPPSDPELDVAFDIVENLLETVYIIPEKAEQLK
jgi:hypothetical protein